MRVRAKFVCWDKSLREGLDDTYRIHLSAVTVGSEENKSFWKYTPNGYLELDTVNPVAANMFEKGKEYYLDFTPASEE